MLELDSNLHQDQAHGNSIFRRLHESLPQPSTESLNLIELAFDLSCTNRSDNEVGTRIGYVTARILVLVSSLRTIEIMTAIFCSTEIRNYCSGSLTAFAKSRGVKSWRFRQAVLQRLSVDDPKGLEPGEPWRQLDWFSLRTNRPGWPLDVAATIALKEAFSPLRIRMIASVVRS